MRRKRGKRGRKNMGSCNDSRISRFLKELFGLDKHAVKLPANSTLQRRCRTAECIIARRGVL